MAFEIIIAVIAVALTLYLMVKGVNIGLIMLINSVFIIAGVKIPLQKVPGIFWDGLTSERTVLLIAILILIMIIENIMRVTGMIKDMVGSLKEILGNGFVVSMLMPTFLGLLPSPGGARFSCPMVEEVLGDKTEGVYKAYINYWFRHAWLDGFILYPGAILAAGLLNVSIIQFSIHILPFTVIHIIIGLLFSIKSANSRHIENTKTKKEALKDFTIGIFPIIFIIILYMVLLKFTSFALQISAVTTIILLLVYKKYDFRKTMETVKQSINPKYILIIAGVMVFMEFLSQSGLVDSWVKLIAYYRIPKEVLFVLLPLIGGVASGLAPSFVSMAFPILIPLGISQNLWYASIAFVSGFIGNMISPLHLCGVMSADYFNIKIDRLLVKVFYSETIMMGVLILLLIALRLV